MDTSSPNNNINNEESENFYELEQPVYCPYYEAMNNDYVNSNDEYFYNNELESDYDQEDLTRGKRRRRRRRRRHRRRPPYHHFMGFVPVMIPFDYDNWD